MSLAECTKYKQIIIRQCIRYSTSFEQTTTTTTTTTPTSETTGLHFRFITTDVDGTLPPPSPASDTQTCNTITTGQTLMICVSIIIGIVLATVIAIWICCCYKRKPIDTSEYPFQPFPTNLPYSSSSSSIEPTAPSMVEETVTTPPPTPVRSASSSSNPPSPQPSQTSGESNTIFLKQTPVKTPRKKKSTCEENSPRKRYPRTCKDK